MIRPFQREDLEAAQAIHRANELPENCFPNLYEENGQRNPLYVIRAVVESEGQPAMMAFAKMTAELFLLVNHQVGTPEERWKQLEAFKEWFANEAWKLGLEQLSAFVPPDVDESFAKRLEAMGFQRTPYVCWTLNL